ncbi:hypothetical protein [Curtobacterium sp. MCSS17_016]|uniref:hypothetical protein n=1 Tax=Curtobacterium sp. MCSS17_016 TaxID=2175644 RepID=UPI000DA750FF|nr:hypothetical protein [Curtobacterium sp. MCSS17_016]WIE81314.1 hypothetical protein DEJ19_018955 [Curtobacterium sp. MCSS17_016]
MTDSTVDTALAHHSVWQHKTKPITLLIEEAFPDDDYVHVQNHRRTVVKRMTLTGLRRNYAPTGQVESAEETAARQNAATAP